MISVHLIQFRKEISLMKKQILTVSLCLGLAAMAGCSCSSPADATTASFPETSPAVTETPAATTALPTESVPETTLPETTSSPETTAALKNVTVSTAALPGDSAKHVAYPVLSGLGDSSQETFWNDLFQKEAQAAVDALTEGSTLIMTWQTSPGSAHLLSLVGRTQVTSPEMEAVTYGLTAYNIDSDTGKAVRLSQLCDTSAIAADLAADDEGAAQTGKNNAYTMEAPDGTNLTGQVTMLDLVEHLSQFSQAPGSKEVKTRLARLLDRMDYDNGKEVSGYSYWEDNLLHLVFPYDKEVADYVDITVKDAHRSKSTK